MFPVKSVHPNKWIDTLCHFPGRSPENLPILPALLMAYAMGGPLKETLEMYKEIM